MGEKSIFTSKEIAFLRALQVFNVDFIIVGAAAAALQGAPIVTQDVDLWFKDLNDPGIRKALDKVGGSFVPSIGLNPSSFAGPSVELFDIVLTMHGLGRYEEEKERTITVPIGRLSVRILGLDRIIKSKESARRPKDLLTVPVLKDALATIRKVRRIGKRKTR